MSRQAQYTFHDLLNISDEEWEYSRPAVQLVLVVVRVVWTFWLVHLVWFVRDVVREVGVVQRVVLLVLVRMVRRVVRGRGSDFNEELQLPLLEEGCMDLVHVAVIPSAMQSMAEVANKRKEPR